MILWLSVVRQEVREGEPLLIDSSVTGDAAETIYPLDQPLVLLLVCLLEAALGRPKLRSGARELLKPSMHLRSVHQRCDVCSTPLSV